MHKENSNNSGEDTTPRIVIKPAPGDTQMLAAPQSDAKGTRVISVEGANNVEFTGNSGEMANLYDQYAVRGKIGDGGMGIVYLAADRRLGRFVAIKRLKPGAQQNRDLRRRFLQEAKAAAALTHPHVVHLYSLGEDSEGPYIVMEYVAGAQPPASRTADDAPNPPQTLEQYIESNGTLPLEAAVELMLKLSNAVSYAHDSGVIHRDLKPSNILMDRSGEPKIADFGLARLIHAEESKLTVPGEKLLSLGYGAPEQESDASITDERVDVYGLGATMFFCLTGQNPRYFREDDLPDSIRPVLCKAVASDRELRWPDVDSFASALRTVQSAGSVPRPAKSFWRCKWCDASNPVTTHFCTECGWDGGESCRECGADTHFGMPFCKTCGANAREYELAADTIRRIEDAISQGQIEAALTYTSRAVTLEPSGPSGRMMLERLHELRKRAEGLHERRKTLQEWIPNELRAENFERARRFIEELRTKCGDAKAFETELANLNDRIVERDLGRVRRSLREQDHEQARRLLQNLKEAGAENNPDFKKLSGQVKRHKRNRSARNIVILAILLAIGYVLALPPCIKYLPPEDITPLGGFFKPARALYNKTPAKPLLLRYAGLWNTGETLIANEKVRTAGAGADETPPAAEPDEAAGDQLGALRENFTAQLAEVNKEFRQNMGAWPADYRRELKALRDKYQNAGDFSAWNIADRELSHFESSGAIRPPADDNPDDLAKLKSDFLERIERYDVNRMRGVMIVTKRYTNELGILLRELTKTGNMQAAQNIDREIAKRRGSREYMEAERKLAEYEKTLRPDELARLLSLGTQEVDELRVLRNTFRKSTETASAKHSSKIEEWPFLYIEALQQFQEDCLLNGDYTGYESARLEQERFELNGLPPEVDPEHLAEPIEGLKARFVERREQYDKQRAEEIIKAADSYMRELEKLISEYTRKRKIEAAAAAAADLRRLQSSAQYTDALAALKDETP